MKQDLVRCLFMILLAITLAGCGSTPATPTDEQVGKTVTVSAMSSPTESVPTMTPTPDPCSTELIEAEVQKVHSHMREFDDAAVLASNLPREELSDSVASLQRIRRDAEDEEIPACLTDLKRNQVDHMNTVINTLVAFMGGADQEALQQGIAIARDQHDQYTLELARLLGLTVVPAPGSTTSAPAETATP